MFEKGSLQRYGKSFLLSKKTGYGPTNGLTDRRIDHQTNRQTDGWMYPLNKKYFKGVENYFLPFPPFWQSKNKKSPNIRF